MPWAYIKLYNIALNIMTTFSQQET